MTDLDRDWAEAVAGVKLTDTEIAELTCEYNHWLDTLALADSKVALEELLDSL